MPRKVTVNGNGLERWRGEVSAKLEDISKRIDDLGDRFEKALTEHAVRDDDLFDKHDTRIIALERTAARLAGKMAVAAMIGGALTAAVAEAAIRHFFG